MLMQAKFKASCAVFALLSGYAGAAYAQDAATDSVGLQEVVVTAQRRTESVQNVPNTIQAFSGLALDQLDVVSFNDLIKLTPNVTFGSAGPGSGNIFMRGLSSGFANNQSSATIGSFPNVAVYLDDQSLTFPYRNVDVYVVDMERVEVLEGPQGTLFGGGAEAGAVRYITNKPKLNEFSGYAEVSGGSTAHGDGNYAGNLTVNVPVVQDVFAVRAVIYDDRRGGYIDNVPSTFTRKSTDYGPASYGLTYPANPPGANNYNIAQKAQNPVTYTGARVSGLLDINDDWNLLVQQSYQVMNADGTDAQEPIGADGQTLGPLQETSFSPAHDHDRFWNTAWTVNGQIGDLKIVYNGAYLDRHIDQAMDYTNYARTAGGFYYQCSGGPASASDIGAGRPEHCYSPVGSWHDSVNSTHHSEELRVETPTEWRVRGLAGLYYEDLDIRDDMNFLYKSIPSCTAANLAIYNAGGPVCIANVAPAPGSFANDPTARSDITAFGEDIDRGYKQYAAYASVDFDIIPDVLTVTGGTRYFKYDEYEFGSQYGTSASCVGLPNGTCYGTPITADTHAARYYGFKSRANVTYHITPDAMVYFTYSEGFRPGAGNRLDSAEVKISVNPLTGQPTTGVVTGPVTTVKQFNKPYTYAPDTLTNFEVGFKTEFFNRRLLLNGSAYYMQWDNVQTLIYNPPVFGNTTFGTNGANYDIKGAELQLKAQVTSQFSLDGSISYNHSREVNSPCITSTNPGNPTPIGQCITQVYSSLLHENVPLVNPLGTVGATPAFSPALQFSLRGRYDFDIASYAAYLTAGVNFTGSMFSEPSSFPAGVLGTVPTTTFLRYTMPSYATVDASIGMSKDKWSAQIYATNLTNSNASTATTSGQFIVSEVPLRPRVVGAKIGMKFGGPSEAAAENTAYTPPPVVAPAPAVAHSYQVFFDFNKSDLTPEAVKVVDEAAAHAAPAKVTRIDVTGHTDTVGSDAYNMRLSRRRAESVAAELEARGIPASEIAIFAKGKKDLLVPTKDGVREPQNRRVQIVYEGGPAA
jgi:outer membrane receptor protein involved in Fe transport